MLTVQTPNKVIPKLIKMADGRIALVHFLVSFEGGEIKAKVLSVQYSENHSFDTNSPLALCGSCENSSEVVSEKKFYNSIISPYFGLSFFVSQPTRAPAF